MIFSIVVYGAPVDSCASRTALKFAQAVISNEHQLYRVFFYNQAAYHGSSHVLPPQDESNIHDEWQSFSQDHDIDMVICVASGLRRGIVSQEEAQRNQLSSHNLIQPYDLSGLGQLVEAMMVSDRVMTFGR